MSLASLVGGGFHPKKNLIFEQNWNKKSIELTLFTFKHTGGLVSL